MGIYKSSSPVFLACILALAFFPAGGALRNSPAKPDGDSANPRSALWQPPVSTQTKSHVERLHGWEIWFVDGLPFTVLGTETEWDRIAYPQ